MNQQLATIEAVSAPVEYTTEQLAIIKKTVAAGCSDHEFGLFVEVCKSTGLNPFARQIYAIKRGDKLTIQTGIDGYRVMAERTGKYAGQVGPFWCGEDGDWKDVWLSTTPPVACKVGILRRDFSEPMWGVARTAAYTQTSNALWKSMPDVMIAKCAEALALRKAFPEQIRGVYTAEEMDQADNPPTPFVDAASAPAQAAPAPQVKAERDLISLALTKAEILQALNKLGIRGREQQRAKLVEIKAACEAIHKPFNGENTLAELERLHAVATAEATDLSQLDMGAPGN